MEFKINIGENFVNDKRDLTILDREIRKDKSGRKWKWYMYRCNKCGFDNGWNTEAHILNGIGCSCCNGKTVVKGINDVATTHPEYVKYFANPNDAFLTTYSSKKKVLMKCPRCGTLKEIEMTQFHRYGLGCNKCGDGISYPEKFVYSFLEQGNINFIYQAGKKVFSWCGDVRYDFYIPNLNCIIETNGGQHYLGGTRFSFKSFEEEQKNDQYKKELALKNGIENYYYIDSRYSTLDWMKNSIIKSGLLLFFNLLESDIDWNKCQEYTTSSMMIEVCNYKNDNPELSTTEIANRLGMYRETVRKYLQRGSELGICIYDKKLEIERAHKRSGETKIKNNRKSA